MADSGDDGDARPHRGTVPVTGLLTAVERTLTRRLAAELRACGATPDTVRVLSALRDGQGRPMGELAELVGMNHPTLTKAIDRMVSDNLVYRAYDPTDRRRVVVVLADAGRQLLETAEPIVAEHEQRIAQVLGRPALAHLVTALERLSVVEPTRKLTAADRG